MMIRIVPSITNRSFRSCLQQSLFLSYPAAVAICNKDAVTSSNMCALATDDERLVRNGSGAFAWAPGPRRKRSAPAQRPGFRQYGNAAHARAQQRRWRLKQTNASPDIA